jgi:hypothetical protein
VVTGIHMGRHGIIGHGTLRLSDAAPPRQSRPVL